MGGGNLTDGAGGGDITELQSGGFGRLVIAFGVGHMDVGHLCASGTEDQVRRDVDLLPAGGDQATTANGDGFRTSPGHGLDTIPTQRIHTQGIDIEVARDGQCRGGSALGINKEPIGDPGNGCAGDGLGVA